MAGRCPRIRLTPEERRVVNKVAHITRCDESWFSLADEWGRGNGQYDEVYDMERHYRVSLRFGLKLLNESFMSSDDNLGEMYPSEALVWTALLRRLGVKW